MAISGLPTNDLKMLGFYNRSQVPESFAQCAYFAVLVHRVYGVVWYGMDPIMVCSLCMALYGM